YPLKRTCTLPSEVSTLPVMGSTVSSNGVGGPIAVPNRETSSPGATGPLWKVAAFSTDVMVGNGAVTVRTTLMVAVPDAVPVPWTRTVPWYPPAARLDGLTDTLNTS